jgi:DNA sulfur modification protein DndD
MYLSEVQLRNWRSYRNAVYVFPRPVKDKEGHNKKVILIGAQNGVGKTSLLIAMYLGLYGRSAMHLIEGIRLSGTDEERSITYKNLLERILHRPALQGKDPYAMVRLKFETVSGDTIIIRRKWGFRAGGKVRELNSPDGEEVLIEVNGDPRQYPTWQEANDRISELLFPSSVMPCFFFDGEQAQARVEAAGGRALLGAVKTLYGTGLLDELRNSLKTYYDNEHSALRKDIGNIREDELVIKREELERIKAQSESVALRLENARREREALDVDYQKVTQEITQLVGDSQADITHYSDTIRALQNEIVQLRQKLALGVSAASLPLALAKHGSAVAQVLRAEQVRDEWLNLKTAAEGKAQHIVREVLPDGADTSDLDPPLMPIQREWLKNRLESALEALWSPPPQGCAESYHFVFLKESERSAVLSKLHRITSQSLPDLSQAVSDLGRASMQLREVQRKYDDIRDIEPKLKVLKDSMDTVRTKAATIASEVTTLENQERDFSRKIRDLRAAIGQMEKRQDAADPVLQKLEVAYKVIEVLDEATEKLVPLCKEALEERCTHHFSQMISDEFQSFRVRFDEDTEPYLFNDGQTIYVSSLSGAQKRAFGLAFTLAVSDVSKRDSPIIIDTPVGNMDSLYRARVLDYVARAARSQVVILSHDEEVSPEYKAKLMPYILKTFMLSFKKINEGCGETTIMEDAYFGDVQ